MIKIQAIIEREISNYREGDAEMNQHDHEIVAEQTVEDVKDSDNHGEGDEEMNQNDHEIVAEQTMEDIHHNLEEATVDTRGSTDTIVPDETNGILENKWNTHKRKKRRSKRGKTYPYHFKTEDIKVLPNDNQTDNPSINFEQHDNEIQSMEATPSVNIYDQCIDSEYPCKETSIIDDSGVIDADQLLSYKSDDATGNIDDHIGDSGITDLDPLSMNDSNMTGQLEDLIEDSDQTDAELETKDLNDESPNKNNEFQPAVDDTFDGEYKQDICRNYSSDDKFADPSIEIEHKMDPLSKGTHENKFLSLEDYLSGNYLNKESELSPDNYQYMSTSTDDKKQLAFVMKDWSPGIESCVAASVASNDEVFLTPVTMSPYDETTKEIILFEGAQPKH